MKKLVLFFLQSFFTFFQIFSQQNSWQFSLDSAQYQGVKILDLAINEDDRISAFTSAPFCVSNCKFFSISFFDNGILLPPETERIIFKDQNFGYTSLGLKGSYKGNKASMLFPQISQTFTFDRSTSLIQRLKFNGINLGLPIDADYSISPQNTIFTALVRLGTSVDSFFIDLYNFSDSGIVIWKKTFNPISMPFNQTIRNIEAKNHSQNGYYFICKFFYKNSQKYESFIVSLNKLGELKNWEKFPHQVFEHLQVADNALYLLGKTKAPIPYTGNAENAVLAKFDLDLNPIWAKIYFGENFEYAKTSLNVAKDGSLIMGYSTFGAFPVSLCKLDSTGNILWQKGYPFYEPQIDVLSDGSILMATNQHFDSTGAIFPKTIIAKTDSLGDLAGCETFESCIESFPTQIMTEDFPLQVVPNPVEFDSVGTESKPDSLQFYPFCDIPAPPSPDFSIPDSVCIGKFIKPMGLKNQLAHGIEWRFEGPYGDTTIQKTAAPKFKMTRPGRHKIAQTIWFLGCDYRTEREIVVLDSLKINIEPSGTICEDPPILLKITSNRPVSSLLWSNGTTEPSFEIFDSGIFSLTATDGFCKAGDSTALVLVKNLIGPGLLIEAGNDTIVCQKKLPFQVRPKSDFTEFFEMKGSNLPLDSTFLIPKAGVFTFSANIFGCVFEDSLRLEVDPCESNIFAPTSFSPNDDGTNDFFTLFGGPEIREIKSLKVFARWGELLFEQNNFQPNDEKMGWDGRFRGKKMPPSVVSWLAEVEFIDDETRFFEGDLTLLH